MAATTMHGARCKVFISDPSNPDGPSAKLIGIFTSVSYGVRYDTQPIYTLGNHAPQEIIQLGQEAISVTASGFRSVGNGPHKIARLPQLAQLLENGYISLSLSDRQTGRTIATVVDCKVVGFDTTLASRSPEEMTVTFMGRFLDDEDTENRERADATVYP